jgi:hypothetical protein
MDTGVVSRSDAFGWLAITNRPQGQLLSMLW